MLNSRRVVFKALKTQNGLSEAEVIGYGSGKEHGIRLGVVVSRVLGMISGEGRATLVIPLP